MTPHALIRSLGALLSLSLATACSNEPELEEIPVQVEQSGDVFRFSWQGDKVHRVEVFQCESNLSLDDCMCRGSLVWGLGPSETEEDHEVALEAPFLASPIEYGVTPANDRKGFAARPLVTGKEYLVTVERVGPCADSPENCLEPIARGCKSIKQP
jgi:hypothetical protein